MDAKKFLKNLKSKITQPLYFKLGEPVACIYGIQMREDLVF